MARISLPSPENLTPEQRRVYEKIVSGPRGEVMGPLRAALISPELADRWQHLGEFCRFHTDVPARLKEVAILVTARRWNAQVEWQAHSEIARKAGIAGAVIDAIEAAAPPPFTDPAERAVYEYARQLQETGQVEETIYGEARNLLGVVVLVELTAVIGYYTMVAMTLNAHAVEPAGGAQPPLAGPFTALTRLAPAKAD